MEGRESLKWALRFSDTTVDREVLRCSLKQLQLLIAALIARKHNRRNHRTMDLDEEAKYLLSDFSVVGKLAGVGDMPECCASLQKDFDRLETWAEKNHL